MTPHVRKVLSRFKNIYGEPRCDDLAGFAAEYERALKGFADDVLQEAASRIIDGPLPYWPKPGEVRKAASDVIFEREQERKRNEPPKPEPECAPITAAERKRRAAVLAELRASLILPVDERLRPVDWGRTGREQFAAMQAESQTRRFHRKAVLQ